MKHKVLFLEKNSTIGGSVICLDGLLRALNKEIYLPMILFEEEHPYRDIFKNRGIEVLVMRRSGKPAGEIPILRRATANQFLSKCKAGIWEMLKAILLLFPEKSREKIKRVCLFAIVTLPASLYLAKIVKKHKIDLMHHNMGLFFAQEAILASLWSGVPVLCHVRGIHKINFVQKVLSWRVKKFIFMSRATMNAYNKCGVALKNGVLIYDGFHEEDYAGRKSAIETRKALGIPEGHFVISNPGRVVPWKGHDVFISAIHSVAREIPNIRALIVGAPDPGTRAWQYYESLRQKAKELGLQEKIIFTGFRWDILDVMAACDIIVHSAKKPEPFGRVVVEGMLLKKPVIASAEGGPLEIIEHEKTGILISPNDPKALAGAIVRLLKTPIEARQIGEAAEKSVKNKFKILEYVANIEKIYQEVLSFYES